MNRKLQLMLIIAKRLEKTLKCFRLQLLKPFFFLTMEMDQWVCFSKASTKEESSAHKLISTNEWWPGNNNKTFDGAKSLLVFFSFIFIFTCIISFLFIYAIFLFGTCNWAWNLPSPSEPLPTWNMLWRLVWYNFILC